MSRWIRQHSEAPRWDFPRALGMPRKDSGGGFGVVFGFELPVGGSCKVSGEGEEVESPFPEGIKWPRVHCDGHGCSVLPEHQGGPLPEEWPTDTAGFSSGAISHGEGMIDEGRGFKVKGAGGSVRSRVCEERNDVRRSEDLEQNLVEAHRSSNRSSVGRSFRSCLRGGIKFQERGQSAIPLFCQKWYPPQLLL